MPASNHDMTGEARTTQGRRSTQEGDVGELRPPPKLPSRQTAYKAEAKYLKLSKDHGVSGDKFDRMTCDGGDFP